MGELNGSYGLRVCDSIPSFARLVCPHPEFIFSAVGPDTCSLSLSPHSLTHSHTHSSAATTHSQHLSHSSSPLKNNLMALGD